MWIHAKDVKYIVMKLKISNQLSTSNIISANNIWKKIWTMNVILRHYVSLMILSKCQVH